MRLFIIDFDGTVTSVDTMDHLCLRLAPETYNRLEGQLLGGKATLREVLTAELLAMRVPGQDIVQLAIDEVPIREGFSDFVRLVHEQGDRAVILSGGFRALIDPMLESAGITEVLPVIANDFELHDVGVTPSFRDTPTCTTCNEQCKRHDVEEIRQQNETVIYVGDGYSDRCGAMLADRVFAIRGLAEWLSTQNRQFEHFESFHDVGAAVYGESWPLQS